MGRSRLFGDSWIGFQGQALGFDSSAAEMELRETTYERGVPTIDVLVFGRQNWGKTQLILRLVNSLNARVLFDDDLSPRELSNQDELDRRRNDLTASMGATTVPEHFVTRWNPIESGAIPREPAWTRRDWVALAVAAGLPLLASLLVAGHVHAAGTRLLWPLLALLAASGAALAVVALRFVRRDRSIPDVELVLWDVPGEFIWKSRLESSEALASSKAPPQNRAARFFSELLAHRRRVGPASFAPILIANPLELLSSREVGSAVEIDARKTELAERLGGDTARRLTPDQWLNPNAQNLYRIATWIDGWVERQGAGRTRSLLAVINYWNLVGELLARGEGASLVDLRIGEARHLLHLDQVSALADGLSDICPHLDVSILRTDAAATRSITLEPDPAHEGWHVCEAAYFAEEVGPLSTAEPSGALRLANAASERAIVTRWLVDHYTEALRRAARHASTEAPAPEPDEADMPVPEFLRSAASAARPGSAAAAPAGNGAASSPAAEAGGSHRDIASPNGASREVVPRIAPSAGRGAVYTRLREGLPPPPPAATRSAPRRADGSRTPDASGADPRPTRIGMATYEARGGASTAADAADPSAEDAAPGVTLPGTEPRLDPRAPRDPRAPAPTLSEDPARTIADDGEATGDHGPRLRRAPEESV